LRPWIPYPVLDRRWIGHDYDWEAQLVERLNRSGKGPERVSIYDMVQSQSGAPRGGWESAERLSRRAIRTGAVFLNDDAIARRLPDRDRRKAAWAEMVAEHSTVLEEARAQKREVEAARAEAQRVWNEKNAEKLKKRAETEAEWRRRGEEHWKRLTAERQAKFEEEQRWLLSRKWICSECRAPSEIEWRMDQYVLTCQACANQGWSHHAELARLMTAAMPLGPIKMNETPDEKLKED
jgi:hypothetical protein